MSMCKGCDKDLTYAGSYYVRNKGPYCRRCHEEVETMQTPQKPEGWLWGFLRRFLAG